MYLFAKAYDHFHRILAAPFATPFFSLCFSTFFFSLVGSYRHSLRFSLFLPSVWRGIGSGRRAIVLRLPRKNSINLPRGRCATRNAKKIITESRGNRVSFARIKVEIVYEEQTDKYLTLQIVRRVEIEHDRDIITFVGRDYIISFYKYLTYFLNKLSFGDFRKNCWNSHVVGVHKWQFWILFRLQLENSEPEKVDENATAFCAPQEVHFNSIM